MIAFQMLIRSPRSSASVGVSRDDADNDNGLFRETTLE